MSPTSDAVGDLGEMRQKLEQLLELLRSTSADTTMGSEREIADSLMAMLQTAAADFFPAAAAMQQGVERMPADHPAPPARLPADALPDDLGPRLQDELVGRYPPAPPAAKQEESVTEGSLWKELFKKDEPERRAPPPPPAPSSPPPAPARPKPEESVTEGSLWKELFKDQ